jgi:hypothetical protein
MSSLRSASDPEKHWKYLQKFSASSSTLHYSFCIHFDSLPWRTSNSLDNLPLLHSVIQSVTTLSSELLLEPYAQIFHPWSFGNFSPKGG